MTGSSLDDRILLALWLQPHLITLTHNTTAIPHSLQSLHTRPHSLFPLIITTLAVAMTYFTIHWLYCLQLTQSLHISSPRKWCAVSVINLRHWPRTENTALLLLHDITVGGTMWSPSRSSIGSWLLPSTDHTENRFPSCLPMQLPSTSYNIC
jgi:hypothetical protein